MLLINSIILIVRACIAADAFVIIPSRSSKVRKFSLSTPLKAKIYYPDDYDANEEPTSYLDATYITSGLFHETPHAQQLAESLFLDPDKASVLARLVSAYAPPGFSIDLSNINSVRCLNVDTKHLEIEAVVCDNYECSTLLVPVDFPKECDVEYGLEECVLTNIQDLDNQGEDIIQGRLNAFADEEEAQKAYDVFKLIGSSDYLKPGPTKLPEWWIPPTSSEDISECDMIEKLLNGQELQLEMQGLCKQVLLQESDEARFSHGDEVKLAIVKAVGPAGMIIEAQVWREGKSMYDDGGINNIDTLFVPIKFASESTSGCTSIKDNVAFVVENRMIM